MSTYGSRLKQERLRLCLTQKQLASAGGVGRHAQGFYERDITQPRADYLAAITLVGIDVLYIITGHHTQTRPLCAPTSCGNGQLTEN